MVGGSYTGATKVKVDLFVLTAKVASKTGVLFEGKDGEQKLDVDLCKDGVKNGQETDVDCGGKCGD